MGKKTDKFIADLDTQGEKCKKLLEALAAASAEMEANGTKWDQWAPLYSAYFNKLRANNIVEESEMVKDDKFKKLKDGFDDVQSERDEIWEKGKKLCNEVQTALNQLDAILGLFNTYVTKKAKSKNPFKSKNSLPLAQSTIKLYQGFSTTANTTLTSIRQSSFV